VPYRVDAALNAMQPARCHPATNRVIAEPGCVELPDRDDTMLPFRDFRDQQIRAVDFLGHMPSKSPAPGDSPP